MKLWPNAKCDCGQLATLIDGSGPHCATCHEFVRLAQTQLSEFIYKSRAAMNKTEVDLKRSARNRRYYRKRRYAIDG